MTNTNATGDRRGKAKKTSKVNIRVFEPVKLEFRGGLKIGALRVVKEYSVEEKGDALDVLIRVVERLAIAGESFFEARVEGSTLEVMGEAPEQGSSGNKVLLAGYPSRLKRIGVLRYEDLSPLEGGIDAYAVTLDKVKWYRPRGEYYVFEGELEAPSDVYLLVVETESDRRIIRVPREPVIPHSRFSRRKQSSELQA